MICWLSNNLGAGREKVEASDLQFFQLWDLFSKYISSEILIERYTRKWKFLHLKKGKSQGVECQSSKGLQNKNFLVPILPSRHKIYCMCFFSSFVCNFNIWPSNFQPVQSCEAIQMGRLKVLDGLGPRLVCLVWGPSSLPNTRLCLILGSKNLDKSYKVFSTPSLVLSWGARSQTGAQNPIVQGGGMKQCFEGYSASFLLYK